MGNNIIEFLKLIGTSIVVTLFWQGLEMLIEGDINPNNVDTVIGLILTFSLYFNIKSRKK